MREETERPAAGARTRRSPFDHFVEATYQQVSGPPFFLICVAIVIGWLVSLPLWGDTKAWQVVIHTVASVLTPLLVALSPHGPPDYWGPMLSGPHLYLDQNRLFVFRPSQFGEVAFHRVVHPPAHPRTLTPPV